MAPDALARLPPVSVGPFRPSSLPETSACGVNAAGPPSHGYLGSSTLPEDAPFHPPPSPGAQRSSYNTPSPHAARAAMGGRAPLASLSTPPMLWK